MTTSYNIGDVIELKAPTVLSSWSSSTASDQYSASKHHLAAINYFDGIISLTEKHSGSRFAVVVDIFEAYDMIKVCPLSKESLQSGRGWPKYFPCAISSVTKQSSILREDYVLLSPSLSIKVEWIKEVVGSVSIDLVKNVYPGSSNG